MTEEELIHRIAHYPQAGDSIFGKYTESTYYVDCAGRNLVAVQLVTELKLNTFVDNRVYTRTEWRDLVYDLNRHITKPEK